MATIKKGTILAFCGGEYSDQWTSGPFVVLRDFDQEYVASEYRGTFGPEPDDYGEWGEWVGPSEDGFSAWLVSSLYVEDVPNSYRWYLGAYGEFKPTIAP